MFYAKSTGGFYDAAIHGNKIPADAVEITIEDYDALIDGQSQGKQIKAGADGKPVAVPPTPPTIDEIKASKLTELAIAYSTDIQQDVAYMSTTFQADTSSQQVLIASLAPGAVPAGFAWLDADNVSVPMTYAQLRGLAGAMLAQGWTAFSRLQERKTAVRAATKVEAIDEVVW